VEKDFQKSAALEVNGFPSVFLVQGNTAWLIARGYTPFEALDERIQKVLHPQTA
jgi:protein-disulfide isomerase-like protein with CxxC motif